jgi:hypothetical protein
MIDNTWKQINLAFWDMVIYALSESKILRQTVRTAAQLWHNDSPRSLIVLAGVAGLSGCISGLMVFLLVTIIKL